MASTAALAKARALSAGKKLRSQAETAERRMVIGASGAAIGFLEQRGTLPVTIMGVPTKLAVGILASFAEASSSGATRRLTGALADTSLAIYGYQAAKLQSFVAGEDDGET